MRVGLLLAGQVGVGGLTDSVYATAALRDVVAAAAMAAGVPRDLAGCRATLETDVAVRQPDVQGREHATHLEQVASRMTWRAPGTLEQHVVGYRARGGTTASSLTVLRRPWVPPTLYGSRLRLLLGSRALEGVRDGLRRSGSADAWCA